MRKILISTLILAIFASCAAAETIKLPEPAKTGGMPLYEAITNRHSAREFADTSITLQELSDLLYITAGVNRPDGLRTYPVAMGIQDIFVYVFTKDGVCKYDALSHSLEVIAEGDHRQEAGMQDFVGKAAVNLAYVQDLSLWEGKRGGKELAAQWGFAHVGEVTQNAYLFAASKGWNAVVRGSFDSEKLSKLMKLNKDQQIKLIHTIGPRP